MEIKSLEDWRKMHLWSQSTLARQAQVDKGVISRLEAGTANCRPETIKKISETLQVPPEQIVEFRRILELEQEFNGGTDPDEQELAELLERIEINNGKPGIPHGQAVAEFERFYKGLGERRQPGQGVKATA